MKKLKYIGETSLNLDGNATIIKNQYYKCYPLPKNIYIGNSPILQKYWKIYPKGNKCPFIISKTEFE